VNDVVFSLDISAEKYLTYYQGSAKAVIVTADDGRKIQFPAGALQKFIQKDGIHGKFRLLFNQQHKFIRLEKIL
jgi:hypothetical protein